ncbi:MAG TPA: hypothetical protein VFI06_11835 [Chitinophagaceae bacterium]|nr:hypothetical protein [Chitinophagaceae bacterium]
MKKNAIVSLFVLTNLLFSCKPSQRILTAWVNPERPAKKYTTVFIGALIQRNDLKFAIEDDLGAAAKSKGFKVVKGYEVFPPNFNQDNMRDKDVVLGAIQKRGCDVILTVAIIDQKSETHYVPGSYSYAPYGGYGNYGAYGAGFYGYYTYWSSTIYDPGYYTTDKTYFIEANAYDVETQAMIWSVQSKAENPESIEKSSKEYTTMLMEQFEKDRRKK